MNKRIIPPFVCPDHLVDIWPDYLATRKKKRAVDTDNALWLIIKELDKLAPGNLDRQKAILEKSIRSGWTDVYELKDKQYQIVNSTTIAKTPLQEAQCKLTEAKFEYDHAEMMGKDEHHLKVLRAKLRSATDEVFACTP